MADPKFDSCRFDFRLDAKNGLTPSKRKKNEKRGTCYSTLFKCKFCGSLFDNRPALMEHKLIHNKHKLKCPICGTRVAKKNTLNEHMHTVHGIGKLESEPLLRKFHASMVQGMAPHMDNQSNEVPPPAISLPSIPSSFPQVISSNAPMRDSPVQYLGNDVKTLNQFTEAGTPNTTEAGPMPGYLCINVPIFIANNGKSENGEKQDESVDLSNKRKIKIERRYANSTPKVKDLLAARQPLHIKEEPRDRITAPPAQTILKHEGQGRNHARETSSKSLRCNRDDLEPGEIRRNAIKRENATPMEVVQQKSSYENYLTKESVKAKIKIKVEKNQSNAEIHNNLKEKVAQRHPMNFHTQVIEYGQQDSIQSLRAFKDTQQIEQLMMNRSTVMSQEHVGGMKFSHFDNQIGLTPLHNNQRRFVENQGLKLPVIYPMKLQGNLPVAPSLSKNSNLSCPSCNYEAPSSAHLVQHKSKKHGVKLNSMLDRLWQSKMKEQKHEESPFYSDLSFEAKDAIVYETESPLVIDLSSSSNKKSEQIVNPDILNFGTEESDSVLDLSIPKRKSFIEMTPQETVTKDLEVAATQTSSLRVDEQTTKDNSLCQEFYSYNFHTCKVCKQLFESAEKMWEHTVQHHKVFDTKCELCGFIASSKNALIHHNCFDTSNTQNSDTLYSCDRCNKTVANWKDFQSHLIEHDIEGEGYNCDNESVSSLQSSDEVTGNKEKSQFRKRKFKCPKQGCVRDFWSLSHLKNHLLLHSGESIMHCDYQGCNKKFRFLKQLKMHQLSHLGKKPLKCELCGFECRQRNSMNWHMKSKHGLEKFQTTDRRTIYISKDGANVINSNVEDSNSSTDLPTDSASGHDQKCIDKNDMNSDYSDSLQMGSDIGQMDGSHDAESTKTDSSSPDLEPFISELPGLSIEVTPSDPFTLYTANHPVDSPSPVNVEMSSDTTQSAFYFCDLCKQLFETDGKLWSHKIVDHEETITISCNLCNFSTDSVAEKEQHNLKEHGIVENISAYNCTWCGKEYPSLEEMEEHYENHSTDGAPMYECPHNGCYKMQQSKYALKNHVKEVHRNLKPKFLCPNDGCNKTFCTMSMLKSHQSQHIEERPLCCNYPGCDKSFRESKHLKVHRMLHTDERPLKCHLCDYACRQRNSMNWHMKSKHSLQKQVTPEGKTVYL